MVTLGVDAHKRTHTVVASDENGAELGQCTVAATTAGHLDGLRWAQRWPERRWAIEDCRHLSRRLTRDLVVAGEAVIFVPPKLMAGARRCARTPGKSDPIDALAVARAALREPLLPMAQLDGPTREVRLLVDHREDLVAERTRIQNRLRWHLHELQLGTEPAAGSLDRAKTLAALERLLERQEGVVARIARDLVVRSRSLTAAINELELELRGRVTHLTPSTLALSGCGALTAAKLVGEVGSVSRFRSRSAFAMHNGTAPIPVWSGNRERFRLNRGGNRQINCALHRIAITQMQRPGRSQEYIAKRRAAGDTKTEAIRALRRRISDEVFRRLCDDEQARSASDGGCLTAAA
jgi:transposase